MYLLITDCCFHLTSPLLSLLNSKSGINRFCLKYRNWCDMTT